jgi:phosphodiesterase/alkaline phosphatase D-like protein
MSNYSTTIRSFLCLFFLLGLNGLYSQAEGADAQPSQVSNGSADIQFEADETLSDAIELQADGGQTVVVEFYATGFSNTVGLSTTLQVSDPSAITAVTGEKKQGYSFPANPISWSAGASEIVFNEGTLAVPTETGSNLKLVGIVQITLSADFPSLELTWSRLNFDFADGTSQEVSPNQVMVVSNLANLPKTFSADLNSISGNQNLQSRRINPGSRFPVQMFAKGVRSLTGYEIRAQIDADALNSGNITFVPRSPFVISVPSGGGSNGGGSGGASAGDESRASIDVQLASDDILAEEKSLEVTGGETVVVEIFATGFSNTVGLTVGLDLDNPAAVAAVTGEKKQGYSFPADPIKWSAGSSQIEFNEGTLAVPTQNGTDLQVVGVVSITLAQGFSSLNVTLSSFRFDFADGTADNVTPGVTVTVAEPSVPATVEVDGNTVIARAVLPEGTDSTFPSTETPLGGLSFSAKSDFSGTTINFTSVVFTDGEAVASTISPEVVLTLSPATTNAPLVTDPPVPVTVTDSRAVIVWGTNKLSTSVINYGPTVNSLTQTATDDNLVFKHRVVVEGLDLGTRYYYQVQSTDAQQRTSEAYPTQPASFQTRKRVDTTPPRIQQGPAAFGITLNSAEIVLITDEAASVEISYGTYESALDQTVSSTKTELIHRIQISGLTSGTNYFYKVKLTDLNSLSFETPALTLTTLSTADTIPPRILGRPSVVGATFNSGVIQWNTNEAGNTAVFYSPNPAFRSATTTSSADSVVIEESVRQHRVTLSNLLSDTLYTYRVRTKDASGNASLSGPADFKTRSSEDVTAPKIVRAPILPRRTDTEVVIVWQTNEPATGSVQFDTSTAIFEDEDAGETASSAIATKKHEITLTNLEPNKTYYYKISVTDLSGNGPTVNPGQLSFATKAQADTSPPVIFSLPVALGITTTSAIISWGADEPHSALVKYSPAAAGKQAGGSEIEVEDIERSRKHAVNISVEPGTSYNFEVVTTDGDGNTGQGSTGSFVTLSEADTNPPRIVRGPVVRNITASSATIDWVTDEPADSKVSFGLTTDYSETIEDATGTRVHSITLTELDAKTEYHYAVGSADLSGNVVTTIASGTVRGVSADHTFKTRTSTIDVAPTFIEGPLVEFTNVLAIVKWKTDQLASSQVAIGVPAGSAVPDGTPIFGDPSQLIIAGNDLVTDHSITVTGLAGGLPYQFRASSTNVAGLTSSHDDPSAKFQPPGGFGVFTTSTEADTQFPVITQGPTVVASTTNSLTIEWQTNESANSKLNFGTGAEALDSEEIDGTNVTAHKTVVTNLDPGTTYAYKVASTDATGNGATESQVGFGTTPSDVDLSAPAITTAPEVIYKTDRSVTVQWVTNEAADAELSFGTDQADLDQVSSDPDFDTEHTLTLTNLTAATTYYFQAASKDQNNNGPTQSSVLEFTTDSSPDITNPVIQNVTVSPGDKSALITWETDEVSDSAVKYGAAGGTLGFTAGDAADAKTHSLTLTNLTPGTEYGYQVESIDRSGNGPAVGTTATFTTFAEGQTPTPDAPAKPSVTAGNSSVRVSWEASASSGITGYIVQRSAAGGAFAPVATLGTATSYTDGTVTNGTEYAYQVISLGSQQLQGSPSESSDMISPAADKGPAAPTFAFVQGNGLSPTVVINNSTASGSLSYSFQVSSSSTFADALVIKTGVAGGAGTGSGDPSGVTAFTVSRTLDDGVTYHYKVVANDGTFDSASLTGNFTADANAKEFPADITGDRQVNLADFIQLVQSFGKKLGNDGFNAGADITGDDQVNLADFIQLVQRFGRKYIQGASGKIVPAVPLVYGLDSSTHLKLVGRPTSTEAGTVLLVDAVASNASNLQGYAIRIDYDPAVLRFNSASAGQENLLTMDGQLAEVFGTLSHDAEKGEILLANAITSGNAAEGEGRIARLRFSLLDDHPQGDLLRIGEGILIDGKFNLNQVQHLGDRLSLVPDEFTLEHNFPNPFNPATTIRYAVPEAGKVSLRIYNVLGQEVQTLVNDHQVAGYYTVKWNGMDRLDRSVASGVYLYKMDTAGFTKVHKMLLLK